LPRARGTGYEPVLAETLLLRSWFESNADDKAGALRDLYEVVGLASAARDDVGLARATNLIASVAAAGKGGFAAADVAYPLALGATARAGNQPALLWQLFHNRANVLYDKGEMATALAFYQLQLLVAPVAYGPDSWQVAVALQDLGDAMTALGAAPQATDLYRRALVLAERVLGPNHDRIATLLDNYGLNLLNVRDADGAAALLERTVTIAKLHHPADSRQVVAPMANLALARLAQRRIPEARLLIDRALQVNLGRGDAADSSVALDLIISGEIARAEGHLDAAHERKQRGIALKAKAVGPGSASEGNALREDASILLLLGRAKDAREAVTRAIPILAKALGKENPDNGVPLAVLADVLAAEGDWKEALATYQSAVAFLEGYAMDSAWLVEPLVGMSAALVAIGDATRASTVAERALAIAAQHHLSADLAGAAELRLAQARWAAGAGPERRAAIELARSLRIRLAALPYQAEVLPEVDKWLAATNVARR
jgi:tetratricopeptide (TPR) repeat protein